MVAFHPSVVTAQHTFKLTPLELPNNTEYEELLEEFDGYTQILLGREPSPIQSPYLSLMEVATAFHSRGREVEMMIYRREIDGSVLRGSHLYRFRTGYLDSFLSMTRRCIDLGSRRLTQETLLNSMREE